MHALWTPHKKNNVILLLILLIAVLVRFVGIDWDLPCAYNVDGYYVIDQVRLAFEKQDLTWYDFKYPGLYTYILALGYRIYYFFGSLLGTFRTPGDVGEIEIWLLGRFITAFFGVGTVLLLYLIGKSMYSRKVGLISSLFLCFTSFHVGLSRQIRPDAPMAFFIMLSFLFVYLIYEEGKLKHYSLAAIFAGFSIATKWTGAVLVLPIFLAHLLGGLKRKKGAVGILLNRKLLILFLFIILGFFLAAPRGLLNFSLLYRRGMRLIGSAKFTSIQSGQVNSWIYYLTRSLNYGMSLPLELLSFAGIAYCIYRHSKKDILLISFPLAFFLIQGSYVGHGGHYIFPMVPFLVIAAALFLTEISSKVFSSERKQNLVLISLALTMILIPTIRVTNYAYLTTQKGTGLEAKEWIWENIPAGSKIAREDYCPYISTERYRSRKVGRVGWFPLQWYQQRKFDYIIISSLMYHRYFTSGDIWMGEELRRRRSRKQNYINLDESCELVKEFRPSGLYPYQSPYNPDPVIKIYRIDYRHPYRKFPTNFVQYRQIVNLTKVNEGWRLTSRIYPGDLVKENEPVRNPYVKLVDSRDRQIAKLAVQEGRIPGEGLSRVKESSLVLSSLPRNYKLYLGYEICYDFNEDKHPGSPFREYNLNLGRRFRYPGKNWTIDFIYQKIPQTHFAEYRQMVALFRSKEKTLLWSKISGGELITGDDYVVDPYAGVLDPEGTEMAKLLIYQGKVGSFGSVLGPKEKSINLSSLPSEYRVYIGYRFYYDASHKKKAGGPLEIEILTE